MKAIGYIRVSTEKQATEGVSLEAQEAKIRAWCDLNDYELVDMYVDAGISGASVDNRPGLQDALKAACTHHGALIVYSLSRLARSTRDTIAIVEQLDRSKADLVSLSEKIDLSTPSGRLNLHTMAAMFEHERENMSAHVKEIVKYRKNKATKSLNVYKMTPDERQAALEFLRDPNLIKRIVADLDHSGLVSEEPNKLVGYLAMVSRKLSKPLAILVRSTRAAGKSSLLETLLDFMPSEDRDKLPIVNGHKPFSNGIVLDTNKNLKIMKDIRSKQIHEQTLDGIAERYSLNKIYTIHHNAQRLLRPIHVVNPYAERLTFLETRNDFAEYLSLIQAVAFLHQYQRPIHMKQIDGQVFEYIEVTVDDIKLANQLANHVLGMTLDELAPHTRRLLDVIHRMVAEKCKEMDVPRSKYRFTRRDLRDYSQWGKTQLGLHLKRLVEHGYLTLTVQNRKHFYECLYNGEGQDSKPFLMGLVDIDSLY